MYATSAGTYESRKFTGDFTVMQNGEAVGTIRLTDFGSDPISVPGTGNVQLVPVAETMPEVLAPAMGNDMITARFADVDDMMEFVSFTMTKE